MAVAMSFSAGFARAAVQDHVAARLLAGAAVGQQGTRVRSSRASATASPRPTIRSRPAASPRAAAAPGTNGVTRLPPTGNDAQPPGDDRYVTPAGYRRRKAVR